MSTEQLKILVVDDNPIHLELIMKALKDSTINCQVDGAASGSECLKIISEKGYDAILLDYYLPEMTGTEILEKIEKNKKTHSDPPAVVIVTRGGDERSAVETIKKGAYDYIIKGGDYLLTLPIVMKRSIETQNLKATQVRMAEELIQAKNYTDNIIKSMIDTLIVTDPEGKIKIINKATEELLGYREDELIGKSVGMLFAEETLFKGTRWEKLLKESSVRDYNMTYRTKIGENISVSFSGSVMYEPRDEIGRPSEAVVHRPSSIVGIVGIARDMREILRLQQKEKEFAAEQARIKALEEAKEDLQKTLDGTVMLMVKIVETKDPYTAGHQQRVAKLSSAIAKEMGLSKEEINKIQMVSLIHDLGKIHVPAEILSKPGKIDENELKLIKSHPKIGYEMLKAVEFLSPLAEIVLHHHERMDGSGYPRGLSSEDIILEAKILGVADVVEAMSSHRPYRAALGIDKALEEISKNKGILYDTQVVDACLKLFYDKGFKFE